MKDFGLVNPSKMLRRTKRIWKQQNSWVQYDAKFNSITVLLKWLQKFVAPVVNFDIITSSWLLNSLLGCFLPIEGEKRVLYLCICECVILMFQFTFSHIHIFTASLIFPSILCRFFSSNICIFVSLQIVNGIATF